jgi:hypothetical protein
MKYIRGNLWHGYSVTVNQFTVATDKHCTWWFQSCFCVGPYKSHRWINKQLIWVRLSKENNKFLPSHIYKNRVRFRDMVFIATFNNIPVISWRSVLFVKETGMPAENQQPVASHWQTLSHNVVYTTHEWDSNSQL